MAPPKNVLKSVKIGKSEIEWYSLSSAYADVPDCITIKKGKSIDTICKSNNIADIKDLGNDTVLVGFYGKPKRYNEVIELPQKVLNFTIIVDTTYIFKTKRLSQK